MSEKFEASKTTGAHFRLSKLVGEWEGITKTWFEPDKIADESPMRGSVRLVLGGRFIVHEYKGSMGGKPLERYCHLWLSSCVGKISRCLDR